MKAGLSIKFLLSLIGTPVLLFISPAITVYLSSQGDLDHRVEVIYPFIGLAIVLYGLAVIYSFTIGSARRPNPEAKLTKPLSVFYLSGPAFLVFTLLREIPLVILEQLFGVVLGIFLLMLVAVIVADRWSRQSMVSFFAVLSLAFASSEAARLMTGLEEPLPPESSSQPEFPPSAGNMNLPNIYHVILDGFHSDVFSMIRTDDIASTLEGFTWFEEAASLYDQTNWSVPSVMLGSEYDYSTSHENYQARAFNSDESIIHELNDIGYATIAYSRKFYQFDYDKFDVTIEHVSNIDETILDNRADFASLWVYRTLPLVISATLAKRNWFISADQLKNLEAQTFLAASAQLESRISFENILLDEASLPATGRYTYIHLLLPHDPFILDASCNESDGSNVIEQSQCAILLMTKYVDVLKELGRYDDSLILIHGDHGERYSVEESVLSELDFRSHRTLLLVKAPHSLVRPPFVYSSADVSLLDVAPTIYEFMGRNADHHEGKSLLGSSAEMHGPRERFYHVAVEDKALRRHRVDGRSLVFEEELEIPHDTRELGAVLAATVVAPVNEVLEAENGTLSRNVDVDTLFVGADGSYISNGNVSFAFNLDRDAVIQLRARLLAPGANNNSSFVRMDGAASDVWHMDINQNWQWQTSNLSWSLSAGSHILSIEYREQVYLDQLEIVAR